MRKTMKKMLAASTVCIIMSGSFIGGSARILAEQYYGWNDGRGSKSPYFLYVTPKNDETKEHKTIVYCFNKDDNWPENWEEKITQRPEDLPLYYDIDGTDETFSKHAKKLPMAGATKSLVNILIKGYPNNENFPKYFEIDSDSARRVTQIAVWSITDGLKDYRQYELTEKENKALIYLTRDDNLHNIDYTLKLYIPQDNQTKKYQHLLGSILIPKQPEKPKFPNPPISGRNPKDLPGEDGQTKYPKGESGEADPPEKPKPEPKPEPMPKPEPKPEPMPEPMPDPAPKPEPMPKPEPKPEPMPKPEPKPESMPKPEPKPQKPTKPSAMASQPSSKALPKTNDTSGLMTVLGTGLLSLLGLGFLAKRKRKQ
ncbi:TPA: thioester-forming surface-anchored protein [Streptococcus equi subsp. zooepidemicus]|nr:thioester-forming surface-anchored protein [Streptococcus equi subsp. zooepidemicus]HEL0784097.1 thioester-forming surface-anchored protein [Streptococcus equi subsp. zooepidemicus]